MSNSSQLNVSYRQITLKMLFIKILCAWVLLLSAIMVLRVPNQRRFLSYRFWFITLNATDFHFFKKLNIKMTAHFMGENMKSISKCRRPFIFLFGSFEFCSLSKLNKMNYCDSLEIWCWFKLEIFYFMDYYRFHSKWTWTLFALGCSAIIDGSCPDIPRKEKKHTFIFWYR